MKHLAFLLAGLGVILLASCRTIPPDPMGAAIEAQCLRELAAE